MLPIMKKLPMLNPDLKTRWWLELQRGESRCLKAHLRTKRKRERQRIELLKILVSDGQPGMFERQRKRARCLKVHLRAKPLKTSGSR